MSDEPKMLEKVARAICDDNDGHGPDEGIRPCAMRLFGGRPQCDVCSNEGGAIMMSKARAALTCLLEPSEGMAEVLDTYSHNPVHRTAALADWQAMIQAILEGKA